MQNPSNTPQAIFDVSGSVADWATRMLPSKSWFAGKVHDIALAGSTAPTLEPVRESNQLEPGSREDPGRQARTFRGCGHYLDTRALRRLVQTVRIDFALLREQQRTGGIRWDTLDALQKYIAETMLDVNRVKGAAARDKMERPRAFARLVEMVSERPNAGSTDSGFCPPVRHKKSIVPIDLEQLRKQACKVLAGGAGHPDSDDDSSSTSSRSSSSEDDEGEEACYKNGVADVFGEKSMVKVPRLKSRGVNLRYTPAANTPNMYWRDGNKWVENTRRRNKSGTTSMNPEKYTGWRIQYRQNKKGVAKFIGLKKYLPRHPDKKPEKAEMERREAMMKSMGDAKIARGLLMGFASERARFKLANKVVGVSYNKINFSNGRPSQRRYLGRIGTGKIKPSTKSKLGYTKIVDSRSGFIRLFGLHRAFQRCKTWRKKKERARDAKKVIKKHRIREKTWSRRCDGDLCRMLDLRYAARAILLRENFAKETGSNKGAVSKHSVDDRDET
eukprot:g11451.t1